MKGKTIFVLIGCLVLSFLILKAADVTTFKFLDYSERWEDSVGRYSGADSVIQDGSGLDDVGLKTAQAYSGSADSQILIEVYSGNYHYNDTAATGFDGSGTNNITLTDSTYTGTADSFWVVEIMDTSAANNDTIMWGYDAGHDTSGVSFTDTAVMSTGNQQIGAQVYANFTDSTGHTIGDRWVVFTYGYWADSIRYGVDTAGDTSSWATWADTIAISADSNVLITGQVYAVFDSIAGHTKGDRWLIPLYYSGIGVRDTIDYVTDGNVLPAYCSFENVRLRLIAVEAASASGDSVIALLYNSFTEGSGFSLVSTDTLTPPDTLFSYFHQGQTIDSSFGPYWKYKFWLHGSENDSTTYNFDAWISGW